MEKSGCLLLGPCSGALVFHGLGGRIFIDRGMGIAEMSAGRRESSLESQGFSVFFALLLIGFPLPSLGTPHWVGHPPVLIAGISTPHPTRISCQSTPSLHLSPSQMLPGQP